MYRAWCPEDRRLPDAHVGRALAALFDQAGIMVADRGGRLVAVGVSLKQRDGREAKSVQLCQV